MELVANAAEVFDAGRPRNRHAYRVPPKCDVICLVHLNGVSNAHDQATAMYG